MVEAGPACEPDMLRDTGGQGLSDPENGVRSLRLFTGVACWCHTDSFFDFSCCCFESSIQFNDFFICLIFLSSFFLFSLCSASRSILMGVNCDLPEI